MISATTTGYGDIVPVTENTRLFDALVVTPDPHLFLLIFVGSAYLFVARRSWERFIMRRIQRSLSDHIVIIGYGTKNSRAVQELIELGADPANIVVVDSKEERLLIAKSLGCTVLKADATHDATLQGCARRPSKAGHHFRGARRHVDPRLPDNPAFSAGVRISFAVNQKDNEVPARLAGADVVVNPFDFAGLLLATTHAGQHIADYLADLATMGGRVRLIERDILPTRSEDIQRPDRGPRIAHHPRRHALTVSGALRFRGWRPATSSWRSSRPSPDRRAQELWCGRTVIWRSNDTRSRSASWSPCLNLMPASPNRTSSLEMLVDTPFWIASFIASRPT